MSEHGSREIREEVTAMVQAKARGGWAGKKHLEKRTVGKLARFLGESHQDLLIDLIDVGEEKVRNREMG